MEDRKWIHSDLISGYYALLLGILFTLAGFGRFLPIITPFLPTDTPNLMIDLSYGYLLGLFPINIWHNLFYLATGISGLRAFREVIPPRLFIQIFGVILLTFTVLGLMPTFNTVFGFFPLFGYVYLAAWYGSFTRPYIGFFLVNFQLLRN